MAEQTDLLPAGQARRAPGSKPYLPTTHIAEICGIAVLTVAGCLGVYRELFILWITWTTDPLRSIGMLIPPASVILTLRVWRQRDWEMHGTWWGLLVIGSSYSLSALRQQSVLLAVAGKMSFSLIPVSLPVFLYGSGIVLLFGGTRVWRKSFFPLGLLLLCQPVPVLSNGLIDIPLQSISAEVARSFATFIGLVPTTPQLRLMFSPDFGMFIAPGCDGIRGAVTMGYVALILGYLKRLRWYLWIAYVCAAVLLGYLFNFARLCILVLYYRAALGHPALEGLAKQADYLIGSCLFLIATLLFLWLASRPRQRSPECMNVASPAITLPGERRVLLKCAAFAAVLAAALEIPSSVLTYRLKAVPSQEALAARMPVRIGSFGLKRTWYEQQDGTIVVEAGAYSRPGSDEIILGVWVGPLIYLHDAQQCPLARGLRPDILGTRRFMTADETSVSLSTGFYDDGVNHTVVVNAACSPASCTQLENVTSSGRIGLLFLKPPDGEFTGSGTHPVSIMLRIDRAHSNTPKEATYNQLSEEAQSFLSGLDMKGLSRAFQ